MMSPSDLRWLEEVILSSGIATRTQRAAIVQRIKDRHEEAKRKRLEEMAWRRVEEARR